MSGSQAATRQVDRQPRGTCQRSVSGRASCQHAVQPWGQEDVWRAKLAKIAIGTLKGFRPDARDDSGAATDAAAVPAGFSIDMRCMNHPNSRTRSANRFLQFTCDRTAISVALPFRTTDSRIQFRGPGVTTLTPFDAVRCRSMPFDAVRCRSGSCVRATQIWRLRHANPPCVEARGGPHRR